jgi:hypothetical protein
MLRIALRARFDEGDQEEAAPSVPSFSGWVSGGNLRWEFAVVTV